MFIIGLIIAGLIIGALGRLVHPGADPMPIWLTIAIGVAASLIAGLLIGGVLGFILAVVIAAVLVAVAGNMRRGSPRHV
ncbi:MAG: GlsB/YeaQ/YmgE family stress response membrane protein [Gaiellaceae bacterium]